MQALSRHARTGQNPLDQRFPAFSYAGSSAAELWLAHAPLSAGEFRDLRFRNLMSGSLPDFPGDEYRRQAFNDAFARRIAAAIVDGEVSRHG
ncbi:hypothetical protein EOS_31555 [Caballeronia mineralivorans PML1(12)]|uniref:Uncharacterized protein n=1 Tax=Caballeronia mineralivorans PML1(12) TaxID=908627 RepID=A0A0J1CNS3_9BURK|nr:hypothetical protein [Caballeronia mineralivorans]KLU22234.1 hypothetical protein EOS_31555 [Caballeronia mineralivorans PML1(12)]